MVLIGSRLGNWISVVDWSYFCHMLYNMGYFVYIVGDVMSRNVSIMGENIELRIRRGQMQKKNASMESHSMSINIKAVISIKIIHFDSRLNVRDNKKYEKQ